MLRQKFEWAWENVPLSECVTLPANGRYPDASFDGFFVRGAQVLSCKAIPIQEVSDHFPASLTIAILSSIRRAKDGRVKCGLMPLQGQP